MSPSSSDGEPVKSDQQVKDDDQLRNRIDDLKKWWAFTPLAKRKCKRTIKNILLVYLKIINFKKE